MERNLKNKIHNKFIEMLLRKNKNWIFEKDSSFIVVKAKASGIYRRIVVYHRTNFTSTVDSSTGCIFKAEFLPDELFTKYGELQALYALSTIGVNYRNLSDYINVLKSQIYILPDMRFPGDECFEVLFRYNRNGNIAKATQRIY